MSETHVHDWRTLSIDDEPIARECAAPGCEALEALTPSPCAGAETQLARDARVAELARDCRHHADDGWAAARAAIAVASVSIMVNIALVLAAWWLR